MRPRSRETCSFASHVSFKILCQFLEHTPPRSGCRFGPLTSFSWSPVMRFVLESVLFLPFFFLEMSYMCVQVHAGYHVLKLNRSPEDVISITIGLSLLSGGQVGWEERRFQIACLRGGIHMLTPSRLCWPASFRYFLTHSLGLSASLLKTRDVYEGSSFFCGP